MEKLAEKKTIVGKLMDKKKLDAKIEAFWSNYQSGSIVWYAEQHVKSFPEGFIASFLETFLESRAGVEKTHTLEVSPSEVDIAIAAAIAKNEKAAINKPSKKNLKKNKTMVKKIPTDYQSVEQALLSDLSKARELLLAKLIMERKAKLFTYVDDYIDCSFPLLFMSEEELVMVEEALQRVREELLRAEKERLEEAEKAKKAKEAENSKKLATKEQRKSMKFNTTLGHLFNQARNTGLGPK